LAVFTSVRPRLFGIAYRMLSSVSEPEDLVQEVWLRWQLCDRAAVVNPGAFLATTTTRLAINALQSARVRRETYIGPWLPEPGAQAHNRTAADAGDRGRPARAVDHIHCGGPIRRHGRV
jgi:DNA-directed RNA polymerase specialized sigma24 family protein